ncbi:hypothetical protein ACFY3U_03290 [Micromonospora sp. NPDC000089]|uniref:hypothetical protein n=1 Tax=unclassified Micromonospora TaxID=2617518 RepID=UPI0036778903
MLSYYVLYRADDKAHPAGLFIVGPATGDAILWDHRKGAWVYNPDLVIRFLDDHQNFDRYQQVERSQAELVAARIGGGIDLPDPASVEMIFASRGDR